MAGKFLSNEFYERDTGVVARDLLGKVLVRTIDGCEVRCLIVETEAYFGSGDPASHAACGRTPRNSVMFGRPGRAYVYFNYGIHYLFNVVTEEEGRAGAVLVRAVEPISGIEAMLGNRPVKQLTSLTSGPAKLTQALGIRADDNGERLDSARLGIEDGAGNGFEVVAAKRVGISAGIDLDYRYYICGNKFVSRRITEVEEA